MFRWSSSLRTTLPSILKYMMFKNKRLDKNTTAIIVLKLQEMGKRNKPIIWI